MMKRILITMLVLYFGNTNSTWEFSVKNQTNGTLKQTYLSKGCYFPNEIAKDKTGDISGDDSCTVVFQDSQGKKAQLVCKESDCDLLQSGDAFELDSDDDAYIIKDKQ